MRSHNVHEILSMPQTPSMSVFVMPESTSKSLSHTTSASAPMFRVI